MHLIIIDRFRNVFHGGHSGGAVLLGLVFAALIVGLICSLMSSSPAEAKVKTKDKGDA